LKIIPRWFCWRYSACGNAAGHFGKIPYNIAERKADYTNPSEWLPFEAVTLQYSRGHYDGIGLVLTEGLCGLDEDHCVNEDGSLDEEAARHIRLLNSYSEFSVSGEGVHCLAFGRLPDGPRRRGNHELYSDRRYFVVTGRKLPTSPGSVANREQELLQLHATIFGEVENCPKIPDDLRSGVPNPPPISQEGEGEEDWISDKKVIELINRDSIAKRYWLGNSEDINPSRADWALDEKAGILHQTQPDANDCVISTVRTW